MTQIILPVDIRPASFKWQDQKFLTLGAGKIGKSEFWCQDLGHLFIETEPGLDHLPIRKLACRSWEDLREIYMALYQAHTAEQPFPYSTIVIDTIDRLIAFSQKECVLRAKAKYSKIADSISTIGDIPEGNGWFWSLQMVENMLDKLVEFPAAISLISHVQAKDIKMPTRTVTKQTISIGGQMGSRLLHWTDHTLNIQSRYNGDNIERIVYTKPTETMEAGSRGNRVPNEWKWTGNALENFAALQACFE